MQRTFAMLKPDCIQRGLAGEVIKRIESRGFKIVALKLIQVTDEQARRHYAVHKDQPFYERVVRFIQSGPSMPMMLEAPDAVGQLRRLVGATDPSEAEHGTIRGDLGRRIEGNLIHAADSPENAVLEASIYFTDDEIVDYVLPGDSGPSGE